MTKKEFFKEVAINSNVIGFQALYYDKELEKSLLINYLFTENTKLIDLEKFFKKYNIEYIDKILY